MATDIYTAILVVSDLNSWFSGQLKCKWWHATTNPFRTRDMFCGTWYLPHSRFHYDRQSLQCACVNLFLLSVWNLTVGMVKMVNLCHRAKFCGDQSNRCGDMAIFRSFRDDGRRHLGLLNFWNFNGRNTQYHNSKFRGNRSNCRRDIAIVRFLKMAATFILDF